MSFLVWDIRNPRHTLPHSPPEHFLNHKGFEPNFGRLEPTALNAHVHVHLPFRLEPTLQNTAICQMRDMEERTAEMYMCCV